MWPFADIENNRHFCCQLEKAEEEETRLREAKERENLERREALEKIYPAPYRVSGRMRMLKMKN